MPKGGSRMHRHFLKNALCGNSPIMNKVGCALQTFGELLRTANTVAQIRTGNYTRKASVQGIRK